MTAEELFLTLLNRSLACVWLILALLLLRPFLRKVSNSVCCAMWGLVAFRLLCPFSVESVMSLIPSASPIPTDLTAIAAGEGGLPAAGYGSGELLPTAPSAVEPATASLLQTVTGIASLLWLIGVALFALYAFGSYLRLRLHVREAARLEEGVWACDRIDTPFILGVFRPRILVPLAMDAEDIPYILAHERAHLARRDHWRKPLAFALLALFWFQPVLWIAYFLLNRDIEFACDERALRSLGIDDESKARYAKALLRGSVSVPASAKLYCPLAFGGLRAKQRVQSVLKYRKPAFSLLLAAVLVCALLSVCFLTDPKAGAAPEPEVPAESSDEPAPDFFDEPSESPPKAPKPTGQEELSPLVKEMISYLEVSSRQRKLFYTCLSSINLSFIGEECTRAAELENTGDADRSITFWVRYITLDQDVLAIPGAEEGDVYIDIRTVTIPLPAGETVYYPFDPGYQCTICQALIVGAAYEDLSVMWSGMPEDGQQLRKPDEYS